ncbi:MULTISPECIES: anti-sigma factor domain-containing protein [unclassified Sphingobacterium]|uniref:anti-sigma factor n=1 Tax=unclassified Sphingobacterium TaxID=2609468 RepID=UPI001046F02D|nr:MULTISPECIES: anti-sigma factor [unclassified Sphingobacterium]MCS3553456.1 anti-sigma-K factor RskA [Sphingobacterium sp. JUb21]TCR09334.1 anti-sigma-K factor RskA [Sphingobacterium sp. JUb20]
MDIKEYISSGIIEAYVLNLASEEEVSVLMCVSKHNTEVQQAILEAQETLEDFATVQAMSPPTELKSIIWNKISDQANHPIVSAEKTEELIPQSALPSPVRKFSTSNWSIAASILLALSIGANIYFHNKTSVNQNLLEQSVSKQESTQKALLSLEEKWAMLQDPAIKTITLAGVEQHPKLKAHVFWNTNTTDVYLSLENLPPAPEGMQYQLWAIVDGKPVDAGVFPLDHTDRITSMNQIPKAQAFAITLETKGGNPTPNLTQLYVMGNT